MITALAPASSFSRDWSTIFFFFEMGLPSLEVEGNMEDVPHPYLIYVVNYVFIVQQATLQS
jgi:hypothetical protein